MRADQAKQVKRDAEDKAAAVEKARQVAAEKTSLVEGMSLLRTIANAPWDDVGNDGVWSCFNEGTSDGALMMVHALKLCYLDPEVDDATLVDILRDVAPYGRGWATNHCAATWAATMNGILTEVASALDGRVLRSDLVIYQYLR